MESKMIESCAMSFELPPLVRSGIFLSFFSFRRAELGFSCFSREGNFGLPVLNSPVPSTSFNGWRFVAIQIQHWGQYSTKQPIRQKISEVRLAV